MTQERSFLFITDSHIGSDNSGWGHHPLRADLVPELVTRLADWTKTNSVDFVVHGGDLIDNGSPAQQLQAKKMFSQFSCPTRLCLGNHDVAQPDAPLDWLAHVPEFFESGRLDYDFRCGPVDIYILSCSWRSENNKFLPWWNTDIPNEAGLSTKQISDLDQKLSSAPDRPAILVVHPALESLPSDLTGFPEPIHPAPVAFTLSLRPLLERHPNIKLLLSGHNHATCITRYPHRIHMSLAAFCEPPFQAMKISVTAACLKLQVFTFVDYREYAAQFYKENAWTVGRDTDQVADIAF